MGSGWWFGGARWLLLVVTLAVPAMASDHRTPIASGYGANGDFGMRVDRFPSPLYRRADVRVFRPAGVVEPVPVIFLVPGYSNNDPARYDGLIRHMVSRGYAVVFTPFHLVSGDPTLHARRYAAIWAGMRAAVERYGASFDLTRVGYVGHSYGGAAIFSMARRAFALDGWGAKGLLLFSMAPWYCFQMKERDFADFPPPAKVVIQVYEDDKVNDHRLGMDIFQKLNLPSSEKEFMLVRSDRNGRERVDAGHRAPESRAGADAIDYYAIYRVFDGLAACAFDGDVEGRRVSLGEGGSGERAMGWWADGRPIRALLAGDRIALRRAPLSFLFPFLGRDPQRQKGLSEEPGTAINRYHE